MKTLLILLLMVSGLAQAVTPTPQPFPPCWPACAGPSDPTPAASAPSSTMTTALVVVGAALATIVVYNLVTVSATPTGGTVSATVHF